MTRNMLKALRVLTAALLVLNTSFGQVGFVAHAMTKADVEANSEFVSEKQFVENDFTQPVVTEKFVLEAVESDAELILPESETTKSEDKVEDAGVLVDETEEVVETSDEEIEKTDDLEQVSEELENTEDSSETVEEDSLTDEATDEQEVLESDEETSTDDTLAEEEDETVRKTQKPTYDKDIKYLQKPTQEVEQVSDVPTELPTDGNEQTQSPTQEETVEEGEGDPEQLPACGGESCQESDPAIVVFCDWLPQYECNQSIICTADISNTASAEIATDGLVGEISVSNEASITSIITDNGLDCSLNNGVITCDGVELGINEFESVLFWVEIDNCPCDEEFNVVVDGTVSADNGDVDPSNNADDHVLNVAEYVCDDCVDPVTNLTIDSHYNNQIVNDSPVDLFGTVEGGVDSVIVEVNGTPYTATINGNTWSVTVPLQTNNNSIIVTANPTDDDCDEVVEAINLVYQPNVCDDPITYLDIDSHTDNEIVTDSPIDLFGTVVGGVEEVIVSVNGNNYTATINGNTWSVTIPLIQGDNDITVTAIPTDDDCDEVVEYITIKYQPNICVDPITYLDIDSHTNNEIVTDSPIDLFGTVVGGVEEVIVSVNGNNYTATINGNTWSVTIPLIQGDNDITVTAIPTDDDCDEVVEYITIKYQPNICVDPITNLTIDSHVDNQVVTDSPIDMFGTVEGGVAQVIVRVNGTDYTASIVGNTWSATVPLQQGNNDIWVLAIPNDSDCDIVEEGLNIIYQPNACVDPITNLTIDSHTYGEVVTDSPIDLFGTVEGGVDEVIVTVNGNDYTATINGNAWSVTIPLIPVDNYIKVKAIPSDSDCDIVEEDILIKYQPDLCVDPITDLTIDSHIDDEVVTDSPIDMFGTVEGGVAQVIVRVNGTDYTATIVGNTWSATVPLQPGDNDIWVLAIPSDSDCDIIEEGINIIYDSNVCVDPITDLTIDSHIDDQVVNNSPITMFGTFAGGVDTIIVRVNNVDYTATIVGNTWTATIPLLVGDNDIWVLAYPSDDDCDIVEEGLNIIYQPDVCVDPITTLTIDSHYNNEVVTDSPIELTGTVEGGVAEVIVNVNGTNYTATINGTTWSVIIPLTPVNNNIFVTAIPNDSDCDDLYAAINIKYQPDLCVDPITDLTIDSHVNDQVVTSSPIDMFGTFAGGVDTIVVRVNNVDYPATIVGNTWSVTVPLQAGDNDIWVLAYPSDDDCDIVEEGINIIYEEDVCYDQFIYLDIDSHYDNQVVTDSPIELTGTVIGDVSEVIVHVNGNDYTATIVGDTWSVVIPLIPVYNDITVTAVPSDDDCDEVVEEITIKYQPNICVDPITNLTVDSHTDGQMVQNSPIDMFGTVEGGVAQVIVKVNGNDYPATINGNTWSVTVPLQAGDNDIWVLAIPSDSDCDIVEEGLNIHLMGSCHGTVDCDGWTMHFAHPLLGDVIIELWDETETILLGYLEVPATNNPTTTVSGPWLVQPAPGSEVHWKIHYLGGIKELTSTMPIDCDTDICEDPITTLTIDSHYNNQVVTDSPVELTGTVEGGVDYIEVKVNGQTYPATINGNEWSATVPLTPVDNDIWVLAYPSDDDCDIVEEGINLKFHPAICVDPITTLTIDSHYNNQVVTDSPVELTGTVEGGVDYIEVKVNGQTYPATINGNEWSAIVPLTPVNNDIWVLAYPSDDDCDIVEKGINLKYHTDVCVDPITTLTIDSHYNNQVVTDSPVELTGTIEGGVDYVEVVVNGQPHLATINGNVWSATVDLTPVINNIWVLAYPSDDDCDIVEKGIVLKYHQDICVDPITDLQITSHINNQQVNNTPVAVFGTFAGGVDTVEVVVNGQTYQADIVGNTWNAVVDLLPGNNLITVNATPSDDDCSPAHAQINLIYDFDEQCEFPIDELTITTPTNGTVTTESTVLVTGTVSVNAAYVEVNGQTASLVNGVYELTVDLVTGVNVISVVAYPEDENCATEQKSVTVTRQTEEVCEEPIVIEITEPEDGESTKKSQTVVKGTVSDPTAEVYVDGDLVSVDSGGNFETTVSLSVGTNVIAVKAGEGECEAIDSVTIKRNGGGGGGSNYCGDNRVRSGEECDDGNNRNGDGCSSNCKIEDPVCGNGVIEYNEQCDDDNRNDGDGCSATCRLEDDVVDSIRKLKIQGNIGRLTARQSVPLELPAILPKTGQLDRAMKQSRVASIAR